jgi:hypothetical protein
VAGECARARRVCAKGSGSSAMAVEVSLLSYSFSQSRWASCGVKRNYMDIPEGRARHECVSVVYFGNDVLR